MAGSVKCAWNHVGLVIGVLASPVLAQIPTFSLEAAGVNGKPIPNGPVTVVTVFAGDVIQAEVYLRDWSPDDQILSGYQAALLPASFPSGEAGYIEPVGFEATQKSGEENLLNSFVDERHPRFVHLGKKVLALADTRSEGYRWMSVVLTGEGPKCKQDGTKFYGASTNLEVSSNARGTFTLALDSDPNASGIRDGIARPIDRVNFEALTIRVLPDPARIVDGLNKKSAGEMHVDANKDGANDYRDVLFSIAALNAKS